MNADLKARLSHLFREIEIDLGSTNLSIMVLESLKEAVEELKIKCLHDFFLQLVELNELINETEPRFAIIIDGFHDVLALAYDEELHHPDHHFPLDKELFIKKLEKVIESKRQDEKRLMKNVRTLDVRNKNILIHDNSRTIQRALKALKQSGQNFRVIVAEQDPDKTGPIIEALDNANIKFQVVPSYMVSHLSDSIDLVFLGALTLKSAMEFVMDPGANGLVSQFHLMKKPIYMLIATGKFSMWPAEKRREIYTHTQKRKHSTKAIEFERVKFSHERVPLHFFNKIITEKGIFTPAEVEDFFHQKYIERVARDEQFLEDIKRLSSQGCD